jgi:hypothetical protein
LRQPSSGGVNWSGRAVFIHDVRANTAARYCGGSAFKDVCNGRDGVASVDIQRHSNERFISEGLRQFPEIPALGIEHDAGLDRVGSVANLLHRALGTIVKPKLTGIHDPGRQFVVRTHPPLDRAPSRHTWIAADGGEALAVAQPVDKLFDDVVMEVVGHVFLLARVAGWLAGAARDGTPAFLRGSSGQTALE